MLLITGSAPPPPKSWTCPVTLSLHALLGWVAGEGDTMHSSIRVDQGVKSRTPQCQRPWHSHHLPQDLPLLSLLFQQGSLCAHSVPTLCQMHDKRCTGGRLRGQTLLDGKEGALSWGDACRADHGTVAERDMPAEPRVRQPPRDTRRPGSGAAPA